MTLMTREEAKAKLIEAKPELASVNFEITVAVIEAIDKYGISNLSFTHQNGFNYTTFGIYGGLSIGGSIPQVGGVDIDLAPGVKYDAIHGWQFASIIEAEANLANGGIKITPQGMSPAYLSIQTGAVQVSTGIDDEGAVFAGFNINAANVSNEAGIFARQNDGYYTTGITDNLSVSRFVYQGIFSYKAVHDSRVLVSLDGALPVAQQDFEITQTLQTAGIYDALTQDFSAISISGDDFAREVRWNFEVLGQDIWEANASALKAVIGDIADGFDPQDVTDSSDLLAYISDRLVDLGSSFTGNDLDAPQYILGEADDLQFSNETAIRAMGQTIEQADDYGDYIVGGAVDAITLEFSALLSQFVPIRLVRDPLIVDLNHDGFVGAVTKAVYFDLDADGNFAEATSHWAGAQDGMIVVDLNNNGRADDGNELLAGANAWNSLLAYDSNNDHVLNASDTNWSKVHIWQDKNSDGYTQADEWYTMSDLGITAITWPSSGETGSITTASGTTIVTANNFATDPRNTRYNGDAELDFTTLFLPQLRGYNHLADLRVGMSLDNTGTGNLLDKVTAMATLSMEDVANDLVGFRQDFVNMMYQWAGVDGVAPNSRGIFISDARNLEFLEEYFGENFLQGRFVGVGDPLSVAAVMIDNVFRALVDSEMTKFLFQSGALDIFETAGHYDRATDSIVFDGGGTPMLDADKLMDLGTAGASAPDADIYWATIAFFIGKLHGGLDNFTSGELAALNAAVAATDPGMDWGDVDLSLILSAVQNLTGDSGDNTLVGGNGDDHLQGLAGADTLNGSDGNDVVDGGDGNDSLQGGAGTDQLNGGAGDDTIRDGTGSDLIQGGTGNDLYRWEGGANDFIFDEGGSNDTIRIDFGGNPAGNIFFERSFNNDLIVKFYQGTWHTITIQDQLNTANTSHQVERLENWLGTQLFDLTNISSQVLITGTSASETLTGGDTGPIRNDRIEGRDGNDIISGLGGNDALVGEGGDDTLYGGTGNDQLEGGEGVDYLYGGTGDDTLISDRGTDVFPLRLYAYNDYLDGGEGNDFLYGGYGDDHYFYSSGHDIVADPGGTDTLELAGGITYSSIEIYRQITGTNGNNDLIIKIDEDNSVLLRDHYRQNDGLFGNPSYYGTFETLRLNDGTADINIGAYNYDVLTYGSAGADTINGLNNNLDTIYAGDGNDIIRTNTGSAYGDNIVYAEDGNDTITTTVGSDEIYGGTGNDVIIAGYSADISGNLYNGGDLVTDIGDDGSDTVDYSNKNWGSAYSVIVDLSDPENGFASKVSLSTSLLTGAQDTLVSIENVIGTQYADTLIGNDAANTFNGGAGNDTLQAGDGDDVYVFSTGSDVITDTGGTDALLITTYDFRQGVTFTQDVDDLIVAKGSDQVRIVDFYNGKAIENLRLDDGTVLDLTNWASWITGTSSGETLTGTSGADTIIGFNGNDTLNGNAGQDFLYGDVGNDIINGGDGNDTIYGGDGNDTINGGDGDDIIVATGSASDLIDGGSGFDTIDFSGYQTAMTQIGAGVSFYNIGGYNLTSVEKIIGTQFNDTIFGSSNADYLVGGDGDDAFTGYIGNDTLEGGAGNDSYKYVADYGAVVTISDTSGRSDSITLNVASSVAVYTNVGDDLEITFSGFPGKITILGQNAAGTAKIEKLIFTNGTVDLSAGINAAPVAQDDQFVVTEGETRTGNVLSNNGNGVDSDSDSDSLSVTAATLTTSHGGVVSVLADGSFSYKAALGYSGSDSFTYTVTDGKGGSDTASVSLTVLALTQHNPVAEADGFTGLADQAILGNLLADNGDGADSDADSDTLSVAPGTLGTEQGGIVTISANGDFNYEPPAGFTGTDTFEYTIVDSQGGSARALVTLSIGAPNAAPVALIDEFEGIENDTVSGNVLADNGNGADSDADADDLSIVASTITTSGSGTVVIEADGDFVYTPATNFYGMDSFSYVLLDSEGNASIGNVVIEVAPNPNPIAADDSFEDDEDQNIVGNVLDDNGHGEDSDPQNNTLTVTAGTFATAHGSVTITSDGNFTYTPTANYHGSDSFDYTLDDGNGGTDTGTVNLTINAVNDAPVAQDDAFSGDEDTVITGNLLANNGNDVDGDAEGNTLSVTAGTYATAHGSVTISSNGNFSYTPTANYNGSDSFNYTLNDGNGGTDTGSVTLTISAVNDNPIAQTDAFSGNEDTPITGNVLSNNGSGADSDPEGQTLSVTAGTYATTHGSVTIASNGSFTYTPTANYNGSDSFTYALSDGNGGTATGTANITINAVNDAPVANTDAVSGNEDTVITGNLLSNNGNGADSDVDGDTLTVTAGTFSTTHGSVTISSNGNFSYTPTANYYGSDSFNYTLSDGHGGSTSGTANVTVNPVNDAPVLTNNGGTVAVNTTMALTNSLILTTAMLTASDVDNSSTQLTFAVTALAAWGALKKDGVTLAVNDTFTKQDIIDGKVSYTPKFYYAGSDSFNFTLSDGTVTSSATAFNINITTSLNLIHGTNATETLTGTSAADLIWGHEGVNTIYTGIGNDVVIGGSGVDLVNPLAYSSTGNKLIYTYGGNDEIVSGYENDEIHGGDGNDIIMAMKGNDLIYGENGNDTLYGYEGDDIVYGGNGNDIIYGYGNYTTQAALVASGFTMSASDTDVFYGGAGNDTIYAQYNAASIDGGDGDDILYGSIGDDQYVVSLGHDVINDEGTMNYSVGQGGDDYILLMNVVYGYNDIKFTKTGNHNNLFLWFSDDVTVEVIGQYSGDANKVVKYIYDHKPNPDEFHDISNLNIDIVGTSGNDTLNGFNSDTMGDDVLRGLAGADTIHGKGGIDWIYGGTGADTLYGDAGDDVIYAHEGSDTVYGGDGNDTIYGFGVYNTASALAASGYSFTYSDFDFFYGGAGNDTIYSQYNGANLYGGEGDDLLYGSGSIDQYMLFGNDGHDIIDEEHGMNYPSSGAGSSPEDYLYLASTFGFTKEQAVFTKVNNGSDLFVWFSDDISVTVKNFFTDAHGVVEYLYQASNNSYINLTTKNYDIVGTSGNDTLNGFNSNTMGDDTLRGQDGDDTLNGKGGRDWLYGGNGNDVLNGGTGADTMYGEAGHDYYFVDDAGDVIVETSGNGTDTVVASVSYTLGSGVYVEEMDTIDANATTAIDLTGNALANTIVGNKGVNVLSGAAGDDILIGGQGNDTLNGGTENDMYIFYLGDGQDTISDSGGTTDKITFGLGITLTDLVFTAVGTYDTEITFLNSPGDKITILNQRNGTSYKIEKIAFLAGGEQPFPTHYGTASGDTINGTTGDDFIYGNGGNDTISTSNGTDIVIAGDGDDIVNTVTTYTGDKVIYGGAGNDTINGGTGADTLDGGDGDDIVHGNGGADSVRGLAGADTLYGEAGNDYLYGHTGNDTLYGGADNDTYVFGLGDGQDTISDSGGTADTILIGPGVDIIDLVYKNVGATGVEITFLNSPGDKITLDAHSIEKMAFNGNPADYLLFPTLIGATAGGTLNGTSGNDIIYANGSNTIYTNNGGDYIFGGEGADTINPGVTTYTGEKLIWGRGGNDTINGGTGADLIDGGVGNDTLYGNDGADSLRGRAGDDILHGGNGDDAFLGFDGADTLYGEAGADKFYIVDTDLGTGVDSIEDFSKTSGDTIDFSYLLDGHYDPLQHSINDFVSASVSGGHTTLKVDLDGAGSAYSMQDAVVVKNTTWTDVATMISSGDLIVD